MTFHGLSLANLSPYKECRKAWFSDPWTEDSLARPHGKGTKREILMDPTPPRGRNLKVLERAVYSPRSEEFAFNMNGFLLLQSREMFIANVMSHVLSVSSGCLS